MSKPDAGFPVGFLQFYLPVKFSKKLKLGPDGVGRDFQLVYIRDHLMHTGHLMESLCIVKAVL